MAQTEFIVEETPLWGIGKNVVAEALNRLRAQPIHPAFTGYLCLKREARDVGREDDLAFRYQTFFGRFLKLGNQPASVPYLMPFNEKGKPTISNAFFGTNIAGSYAPSSIRPTNPLRKVVEITGSGRKARFRLVPDHAKIAAEHMLSKKKIHPFSLAVVLYRDFGLFAQQPNASDLLTIFKNEFGYRDGHPEEASQFEAIFDISGDLTKLDLELEPLL